MYVELLAERLGLTAPTISFHLKKLADAGAVRPYRNQYYTMYALCRDIFDARMIDIIAQPSDDAMLLHEREAAYRQKVIGTFFEYGKLKSIPAQRKKKRIVLEEIAKAFESGQVYQEREVNIIIADYHDDFCTIRRDMISEGLLERENGQYRRTDLQL